MVDVRAFQHLHGGNPDHIDVCPQGAVVNVPNIQLELLGPADGVAAGAKTRFLLLAVRYLYFFTRLAVPV